MNGYCIVNNKDKDKGKKQIVWKVGVGLVAGGWVRNGGGKVCFQCIFEKQKYF